MDSYGNLCGTKNNWDGTNGPDLTFKKKLYYLNPLELLNPSTLQTAKAICVDACPTAEDVCGVADFPCRASNQYRYACYAQLVWEPALSECCKDSFGLSDISANCNSISTTALLVHLEHIHPAVCQCRCPYYRTAEHALYGTLTITGVNIGDSTGYADTYWDALPTTNLTIAQCGIDLPNYPNKFKSAFMTDPNNPACGQYLQFTSQYPGSGPCYPVLVSTVDHLNR